MNAKCLREMPAFYCYVLHHLCRKSEEIFIKTIVSNELNLASCLSERGQWKSRLKAQHSENKDHGIWSHPFWQIDEETVETVSGFIFGGSKITADGEIKTHLLLGRKVMTNLDSILKSRDITLSTKVHQSRLWFFQ